MAATKHKEFTIDLDGRNVPVVVRRNRQARRIILRIDPKTDGVKLTLPTYVAEAEGVQFLETQKGWLRRRLAKLQPRVFLDHGAVLPFLGDDHTIVHEAGARRGVWRDDGCIFVSGQAEHVSRRVLDWLRKQAKTEFADRSLATAQRIGVRVGRVTVRDTTSRWGSCAQDGSLNYSWRLVMAPELVVDYIVAHEVAHIVERNHGPDFHALVDRLTPHADQAEAWLNAYGPGLHRIG